MEVAKHHFHVDVFNAYIWGCSTFALFWSMVNCIMVSAGSRSLYRRSGA